MNLLTGASLLALAKSIYYYYYYFISLIIFVGKVPAKQSVPNSGLCLVRSTDAATWLVLLARIKFQAGPTTRVFKKR